MRDALIDVLPAGPTRQEGTKTGLDSDRQRQCAWAGNRYSVLRLCLVADDLKVETGH